MKPKQQLLKRLRQCCSLVALTAMAYPAAASSHREAPLISNDPLADNTDLYAFRCPDDTNKVAIIADFIPFQLPEGGPNYYTFGENVRYLIHIRNQASGTVDDITYRFTFHQVNEDSTTFFNIRLHKQNIKTTYTCEKSTSGGGFVTIISNGIVPANNIGPRSIESAAGLNTNYQQYNDSAITTANGLTNSGEIAFCGHADDPFFVDLGGIFDLGNVRPEGNTVNPTKDGLARYNISSICLKIPITALQKSHKNTTQASTILDPDFVIGVWASTERQAVTTLTNTDNEASGPWVQVSRLGMPLTNEAIIPIGQKDKWNATNPYTGDLQYAKYFSNPELALYMDDSQLGSVVPALNALRVQSASLGMFDFRNNKAGLYALRANPAALAGTAFDPSLPYENILLPDSTSPRAVDILPIFYTGVPNLAPYQLASGKPAGSPLSAGKPFINNFLPTLCDMLRLNMAVPVTPRNDPNFSSLGIVKAAVIGLTDTTYANNTNIQFIPNMDGFPNGRRLEDDVTTIELQAVSGVALAAIGLWYNDYTTGGSPVTPKLLNVLGFTAGPTHNDTTFRTSFPYVQLPWRGADYTLQARF